MLKKHRRSLTNIFHFRRKTQYVRKIIARVPCETLAPNDVLKSEGEEENKKKLFLLLATPPSPPGAPPSPSQKSGLRGAMHSWRRGGEEEESG